MKKYLFKLSGHLLVLGSSVFLATNAMARTSRLACNRSTDAHVVDTSYIFTEDSNGFRLDVRYAPGATPIESDPTTTVRLRDLKTLPERAALFSRLPHQFSINFPKDQCIFKDAKGQISWHCFVKEEASLGDLTYKGLSFFVYSQKVQSVYGESTWYNLGLEFQLSYLNAMGPEAFNDLLKKSSPSEKQTLLFRQSHETLLRSSIVTFENSESEAACYLADQQSS